MQGTKTSMKVDTVCHFYSHPNGAIGGGKDVSELSAKNIDVANTCIALWIEY
jgi:hypothetical protein